MELHKKIPIKVLDVESPNNFWFRTLNDAIQHENDLDSYIKAKNTNNNYVPKVDDVIAVKLNDKFVIARVICVPEKNVVDIFISHNERKQQVPLSDVAYLNDRKLLDRAKETLLLGSISGVCPAKNVYPTKVCDSFQFHTPFSS